MDTEAFESVAQRWLTTLQQDLKDFLHVVCDDVELDDELRAAAAGAVLYTLAPGDVIPDSAGPLGYVDDALALRIVLGEIADRAPARFENYQDRIPDLVAHLDEDLNAARAFLQDSYEAFRARILAADKIEFKGKRVADALADPEWFDDEVALVALKLDFRPADIHAAARRVSTVLPTFRSKLGLRK